MTKEEAQEAVGQLIAQYQGSRSTLSQLSEADVQASYIERLLLALGWNVYNEPDRDNSYHRQEYIRSAGYADAGLKIAGEPVLFLEAKRFGAIPRSHERVGDRTPEEKQAFRYARAMRLPYVILTNFERLHLFNADQERLILAFDEPQEYLSRLDDLLLLSPERVKAGSLPRHERQMRMPDVDESFLGLLRRWRLALANAIYENNQDNPALKTDSTLHFDRLMEAVQRILDRLILIRYADDKEVLLHDDLLESRERDYRSLGAYAKPDHLVQQFIDLSQMMNKYHNTAIFALGHICEQVFIPNETLAQVLHELNNISFRKFTSDILGNTYESYLSTKLVLRNNAIVAEERREIRKGKGIYYTPGYIVQYIVDNTLGRLLRELEETDGIRAIDKAKRIKVLDPACGSGSFLIYAYQVLADFYQRMNKNIHEEQAKLLAPAAPDMFQRLELLRSLPEPLPDYQRHILEEQLFGVDLDPEAAEIAAVNLTMQAFADARREKLPLILEKNVKVGNSLISGTPEELKGYFGDQWQDKHPFNWEEEFPDIMKAGGFDVVIGNPPYVRIQSLPRHEANFYRDHFKSAYGSFDIYVLFIEQGTRLLKKEGGLGFICSGKFLKSKYGKPLQQLLFTEGEVEHIVDFSAQQVFAEATTYPVVIIFQKAAKGEPIYYTPVPEQFFSAETLPIIDIAALPTQPVPQKAINQGVWPPLAQDLQAKLDANSTPLKEVADRIFVGLQTSADDVYILEKRGEPGERLIRGYSRATQKEHELEEELLKPLLSGQDIGRYGIPMPVHLLLFPYQIIQGKAILIPERAFQEEYPRNWEYLCANKEILERREEGKFQGEDWYRLGRTQNLAIHEQPKLAIPRLVKHLEAVYDPDGAFYLDNVDVGGLILKEGGTQNYLYLLSLLHSHLLDFCFRRLSAPFRGGFRSANRQFIEPLPIRCIDLGNPSEKKQHDDLVALAGRMLDLKKRQAGLDRFAEEERRELEREVERTDRAIDNLVYDLYGLTEEERQIIEAEMRR